MKYKCSYHVTAGTSGNVISSDTCIIEAPNFDAIGEQGLELLVLDWVHDNDPYADPRIDPRVTLTDYHEIEDNA